MKKMTETQLFQLLKLSAHFLVLRIRSHQFMRFSGEISRFFHFSKEDARWSNTYNIFADGSTASAAPSQENDAGGQERKNNDELEITGTLTMGSELELDVTTVNGAPQAGYTFDIIQFGQRAGATDFSSFSWNGIAYSGHAFVGNVYRLTK